MRLSVITEHRFQRTPDGGVWSSAANAYSFWSRYLSVFDEVNAIARIQDVERIGDEWIRADGERVRFSAVPYYIGPYQYALRWRRIRAALNLAIRPDDAVLMRVPSVLANTIEPALRKRGQLYGLEVVGDPYDAFAAIRHPLRPLFLFSMPRILRNQCRRAAGVAYVTKRALQERYPCGSLMVGVSDAIIPSASIAEDRVFTTHYSSLSLPAEYVSVPRAASALRILRVICVGTLEQFYKGHDILLRAVGQCVAKGLELRLVLVGDGRIRPALENLARELGIRERIEFLGQLSQGRAVLEELDRSDLFVLASRTEGLPRALIEAMARGLPCISTTVGGIPELLPPEDLVPPGDVETLAAKIQEIAGSAERRERMSHRNITKAHEFAEDVLEARREAFYRHIRAVTAAGGTDGRDCRRGSEGRRTAA